MPNSYFELVEVRDAKPLDGFNAHVIFTDGTERDIDLGKYLHGPVFEPIRNDPKLFRAMRIDGGTIAWSNEADIAPETLYYGDEDPPWEKARAQRKSPSRTKKPKKPRAVTNGKLGSVKRKVAPARKSAARKLLTK